MTQSKLKINKWIWCQALEKVLCEKVTIGFKWSYFWLDKKWVFSTVVFLTVKMVPGNQFPLCQISFCTRQLYKWELNERSEQMVTELRDEAFSQDERKKFTRNYFKITAHNVLLKFPENYCSVHLKRSDYNPCLECRWCLILLYQKDTISATIRDFLVG